MFGHKNARPMETFLRSLRKPAKVTKPSAFGEVRNPRETSLYGAYVRAETYFVVTGASRWIR
jgi:hypothetical protein